MQEVLETNNMIAHEKLDVRTITMGISLLDCVDSDLAKMNEKIYNKITTYAKDLVSTGDAIGREFGVPIVNKRISVTPIALVGGSRFFYRLIRLRYRKRQHYSIKKKKKTKKKIKNLKNLLTFGSECDKVNELLISNESQKSLKKF